MTKVAVGIVKHPEKEKYLLVRSTRDFGEYTGYYYPPGGHVGDESIPDALRREFREELSLEISPVRQIAETEGDVKGQTTFWWECEVVGGGLSGKREELADAG